MKKGLFLLFACMMLFGSTLTVSANEAALYNDWCHPGAADPILDQGVHVHSGETTYHRFVRYKCSACGKVRQVCYR